MTEVEFERALIRIKDELHEAKQWREVERVEALVDELLEQLD